LTLCCRAGLCSKGWPRPDTASIIRRVDVPPPPEPVRGGHRGRARRDPRRPHGHPHGRRGSRERGRPLRRGRARHGRARQLHGDPRTRARLPPADLAPLAGFAPAGVICDILREDGTMARLPDLEEFAARHDLKIATIADLIEYRSRHDSLVHRTAEARITTRRGGDFRALVYTTDVDEGEHLVLAKGDIRADEPTLVRTHLEYLPGDVFGYRERDTRSLLQKAMERIAAE